MLSQRKVERKVQDALASDERWRVIVRGDCWLCPYCLRIGARGLRMDEPIESKLAHHFVHECGSWDYFEEEPHPIERLRDRARFIVFMGRVVRWFVEDPRFRFTADRGRWICPYCASPTDARIPDHPLDDPDAWGAAPEDSPFLEDAVSHLLECREFGAGEDQLRSEDELAAAANRHANAARLDRLRVRFETEPSFQLVDAERRWLCPFCGLVQAGVVLEGPPDDPFVRELAKHLVACKAYTVLAGRPLPVEELRQRVQADARARALEKVRSKIEGRPLWRARDLEGRWYCPYCARATGIVYPDAADARDPFVVDVFEHLEACEAYRRPGARIQEQRAVAAAVEAANVAIDRRRRIGRLLREVRLYGVRDPFDCWVCPHCQRAQKSIVLRGPGVTAKEVEQVTRHLFGDCPDYRDGAPPAIGLQALEELARPPSNPVASNRPAEPSATGAADATWRRLRQDLDAVKNQVVADKRRHATSLREARSKQRRLLPALPDLPGYEFARVYDPCDAVGGDFYHVFEAAPGLWGVAIGDIAGHGIEAALLMGLAKKLLEVHGRGVTSPAQTLCMANRDIYSDLDERTFVTVFYGLLDVAERRFRFARAGHDPLLLWQADSSPRLQVIDSRGMALGVDEGPLFEQTIEELEVSLAPGDLLLQVTDGVTETPDAQGHQFGAERLHAVVEEHGQHEVEYVLWKIEKALEAFRGGAPRADDVTMVGFKVLQ